ncbi:hypothetical protein GCK72_000613 [Caenorhabditis remanei]|uniref:F-box domain-containing protein n=1 Tax=Caenorhabditis remanei TaxID=31234 RepID=E3M314_CAERE|nr:hypothetical protein GCK72_000613 [Caenorhabditis remanei]EFO90646.1 hypothetical protein CRE_08202 [Caenorhabditis remanei]KAF1768800.1 hypothetical protein GCK72_000613 [Caenorhabditis remanei]
MKLFNLPYLAYSRIITSMNPIEVISLSFCSKRTRNIIKQVRFPDSLKRISTEEHDPKGPVFQLGNTIKQFISIPFQPAPRRARSEGRRFTGTIDGVKHYFRSIDTDDACVLYTSNMNSGFKIINYFLDLIRGTLDELMLDFKVISDLKGFMSEPCMKSLQKIEIVSDTVSSEQLSVFFNNLKITVPEFQMRSKVEGPMDPNLSFLQTDRLYLKYGKCVKREHLLRMDVNYMVVFRSNLDIESIFQFIKHWRDGNNMRLTVAKIQGISEDVINKDRFISEFNAKPWDPSKRDKCYTYDKDLLPNDTPEDCSDGIDFERHDGLLATIRFMPCVRMFLFFVWHQRRHSEDA